LFFPNFESPINVPFVDRSTKDATQLMLSHLILQ
jgi:hypothetical protein